MHKLIISPVCSIETAHKNHRRLISIRCLVMSHFPLVFSEKMRKEMLHQAKENGHDVTPGDLEKSVERERRLLQLSIVKVSESFDLHVA